MHVLRPNNIAAIINILLLGASFLFLWYSLLQYTTTREDYWNDDANKFQGLVLFYTYRLIILLFFSCLLLCVSVYGYMSVGYINGKSVFLEMLLLAIFIILKILSVIIFYNDKIIQQNKLADSIFQGVVLFHKSNDSAWEDTLDKLYGELNDPKFRCCGVYSWKDAESFRPMDCCRRGYQGMDGLGQCHPNYGPYVKSCPEVSGDKLIKAINKYTLIIVAMILVEFLGIMVCGMVAFTLMNEEGLSVSIIIQNFIIGIVRLIRTKSY